jgi:hypothetical protein
LTKNQKPSFLSDLIENLRTNVTKDAVEKFRVDIWTRMSDLNNANNLRVFDGKKGGVLRGNAYSRKRNQDPETGNVLCSKKRFKGNSLEVPYFQAVFNSLSRRIEFDEQSIQLVGYETPLMRKKAEKSNDVSKGRYISCDLLGITDCNQALCIEGKVNPKAQETDIVYGILESYAYGVCVEYLISEHSSDFTQEVKLCVNDYKCKLKIDDDREFTSAFSLAAPRSYFREYFFCEKHAENQYIGQVSKILEYCAQSNSTKSNSTKWYGFLVFQTPCKEESFEKKDPRNTKDEKKVELQFKDGLKVEKAECLEKLKRIVCSESV